MKDVNQGSLTKIIATIGPACNSKQILRKMIVQGLDVFRLNFSHGTHADHEHAIHLIQELNEEMGTNIAILVDLQGPKLRIGDVVDNGVFLEENSEIKFMTRDFVGTNEQVSMSYKQFPMDVNPGEIVLVDDGKIKLQVLETNRKDEVTLKVISGGMLSSRKGVNLPNTKISLPSLTKKDIEDVTFALKHDIQWIALSFVRNAADIKLLKKIISKSGKFVRIISKIEKPEAVKSFDEILEHTDGVMVARGDLGVETPFEQVPVLQKALVRKCIEREKPVIIATQMMEGMITNFLPTRAEATDVSNAVLDGADAVMLSGETSMGKYPVEVIENMQKVIYSTEASGFYLQHDHRPNKNGATYISESVCYNACKISDEIASAGIVVFTYMGGTALRIASYRPNSKILAFTSDTQIMKQLSLVRGVQSYAIDEDIGINMAIDKSIETLKRHEVVAPGDRLIFVVGIPMNRREAVNSVHIAEV
jgi:pyruvate kinase